ncbi:MAG: hypothetical protein M3Z29_02610 [Pseudomonadota bacterium]|nr:hypothetical protein [Pseudomonadota bacterium]
MPVSQHGVVMWVALVVLIVMTLAGLAMMRQMGGGVSIAGNIGFKQNATSAADAGTEVARQWFIAQTTATLSNDVPAAGYFSTWGANVDPTTMFNGPSVAVALEAGNGNSMRYVIHRLCLNPGAVDAVLQRCSDIEDSAGGSKGGLSYGVAPPALSIHAYYRVTVQVLGPRNTVSYTQVVLS